MNKEQLKEFFERLFGPEGCNFRKDKKGEDQWNCGNGDDKTLSIKILRKMGIKNKDIKIFLSQCEKYGGYCDCEIIFNAMDHFIKPEEDMQLTSDELISQVKMRDNKSGKITIKVDYINGREYVKIDPSERLEDRFDIYFASIRSLFDLISDSKSGEYAKNARLLCEKIIDLHEKEKKIREKEAKNEQKSALRARTKLVQSCAD